MAKLEKLNERALRYVYLNRQSSHESFKYKWALFSTNKARNRTENDGGKKMDDGRQK